MNFFICHGRMMMVMVMMMRKVYLQSFAGIGCTIDSGGTAEWQIGYVPNLPDIFTVHTDDDDNDDTDTF